MSAPEVAGTAAAAPRPAPAYPRSWLAALLLAAGAVFAGWFGPIQILLPAQAANLAEPGGKEALLALVTGIGAVVSLVANPVWGVISDRLSGTVPRRRTVLVAGVLIGSAGLGVLAVAGDAAGMIAGWSLVQIGLNGPLAALIAMIADRVPAERRGLVGALFGVAQTAGVVLGTATAVVAGEGALGYIALAVAVPLLCIAIVLMPERRLGENTDAVPARQSLGAVLRALRPTASFTWAWIVRLLLNLANALVLTYLYYFLLDMVKVDDPGTWVLVLTGVNVLVTAVVASVGGIWSDRIAKRRVFALAAILTVAVGVLLIAFVPTLPVLMATTVLLGIGWGLYMAVDIAIITEVLPSDRSTASMLGLANIAAALPQVLAPALAAPIVISLGGYSVLYIVTAVIALLALPALARLRTIA